jgi:serine/threonine-protein kinase
MPAAIELERLRRLNALLQAGLAFPKAQRAGWLRGLADADRDLAPDLAEMLVRGDADPGTFMRWPAALSVAARIRPYLGFGDQVGPYRLLGELGSGGMGTVWLAERVDGGLQRRVALKLPRAGAAPDLAARMRRERDILAALEHPWIARLYDAGVGKGGRPWLAMEHVDGLPIDRYCRERAVDLRRKLRLFLQIADAVAYAHGRLIVHRDLKPGNVLVNPATSSSRRGAASACSISALPSWSRATRVPITS